MPILQEYGLQLRDIMAIDEQFALSLERTAIRQHDAPDVRSFISSVRQAAVMHAQAWHSVTFAWQGGIYTRSRYVVTVSTTSDFNALRER